MKSTLTLLLASCILTSSAIDPKSSKARTILCNNLHERDTVEVVIALRVGTTYRALKAWPVAPGLDTLITGVHEPEFVYYVRYRGRNVADYQYSGPDAMRYRFTPPLGDAGDRLRADVNGVNANEWVSGFPVVFDDTDSSYTIVVVEPSHCKGKCVDGHGRVFNFMEFFDTNWSAGVPNGKGRIEYGDTIVTAIWHGGVLDGPCSVKFGRVRDAKGSFVNGAMHGEWRFEDHTRDWSFRYTYNMGVLEGFQVQRIDGVETKAYFINGVLDPTQVHQTFKHNLRKR
ncbi:MAG: hypothetical protein IPP83_10525 [Flavobacteriales bacterium]|nr:hypothetical protein [Flavobacteriales bacterium]